MDETKKPSVRLIYCRGIESHDNFHLVIPVNSLADEPSPCSRTDPCDGTDYLINNLYTSAKNRIIG